MNQWTKLNPAENFKRVKLTPNEVTLKWDPVEYAVYYKVFYTSTGVNLNSLRPLLPLSAPVIQWLEALQTRAKCRLAAIIPNTKQIL